MSDTVCVMYEGVIQQAASPLDIYLRPANKFVATFVGANNFLSVKRTGDQFTLMSGGAKVLAASADTAEIVCAIRPETIVAKPGKVSPDRNEIAISARLLDVSFVGREMEVIAVTDQGETLKSLARPDPEIIELSQNSSVTLCVDQSDLAFFEAGDAGGCIG